MCIRDSTLSNVKFTERQFCSVVSLMKVKFVDGSVAGLITMPLVILVTSVPAVSQRTRLIPGPDVCARALNPARLQSAKKSSAPNRKKYRPSAPQACLVIRLRRSYLDGCLLYTSDAADERSSVDL